MKRIMKAILPTREAMLFDTPLFIIKSFFAILCGYVVFNGSTFIGRDMISLLFGIMLTLEPVNAAGLKKGFEQLTASAIGGATTAAIVMAGGVNFITVPLSVAVVLYITLRMNWRSMSVIAVFTSIYMTQFIQYASSGEPSMALTLELRLISLGTGILIAIAVNFIFSLFFYRSMLRKRTIFIMEQTIGSLKALREAVEGGGHGSLESIKRRIIPIFNDIDFITGSIGGKTGSKAGKDWDERHLLAIKELRDFNHCLFDLVLLSEEEGLGDGVCGELGLLMELLEGLKYSLEGKGEPGGIPPSYGGGDKNIARMHAHLRRIYGRGPG
ncbi:MAG: aromatic acid exporter family protein [Clostridia bacterium]